MNYDVIIIGAATSGAYFAKKMALKGYSVIMLETLIKEKYLQKDVLCGDFRGDFGRRSQNFVYELFRFTGKASRTY